MRFLSKALFLVIILSMQIISFSTASGASASNIYIAQNASGSANGSSCANAYPYTFFNTSGNWGQGGSQIGPGTTVHLCGTITAPANACNYLSFQGSGSSGSPVTLLFEPGAMLTAPTWGAGCFAIYSTGHNYITIDGGNTGSAVANTLTGGGTIQATANGTGLTYRVNGNGVGLYSCSNCVVKNLVISDIYVHTCTLPITNCTDESGDPTGAIYIQSGSHILVTNNLAHDMKWAFEYQTQNSGATDVIFSNNQVYNADHGFVAATSGATNASITNVYIFGNWFHDPQPWDDYGNNNHHDGVHMWANGTGNDITHSYVYNNEFSGDFGHNFNGAVYQEAIGYTVPAADAWIFNNVVAPTAGAPSGNGYLGLGANGGSGGWTAANNTIVNYSNTSGSGINFNGTAGTVYNNIDDSVFTAIYVTAAPAAIDYQDYYNIGSGGWSGGSPLSAWVSWCEAKYPGTIGCDANSISGNPNLNGSFVPNSDSPVIAAGKNLYSTCNGQSNPGLGALCYDAAGAARPASGNWDIGAYQSVGSGAPAPPSNLVATPQ